MNCTKLCGRLYPKQDLIELTNLYRNSIAYLFKKSLATESIGPTYSLVDRGCIIV
jgi:hypothetical protein